MQKIVPHLWFDKDASKAAELFTSLFDNSKINSVKVLSGTPSGDVELVSFNLGGLEVAGIGAGPDFKLNPSASFFCVFEDENKLIDAWKRLIDGGKELMPLQEYPWAKKYGWLQDKFGVSWQLSLNQKPELDQKISPFLMFVGENAGKAKEAIAFYTKIFKNSSVEMEVPYEKGDGDVEGYLKHARFALDGLGMMAIDSSADHKFQFNEAFSLIVNCESQEEIDYLWEKLSAVPASEQCGWLKDKYGLSWQIVPTVLEKLMGSGTSEQTKRVTEAFLAMKKFDIEKLQAAFDGE